MAGDWCGEMMRAATSTSPPHVSAPSLVIPRDAPPFLVVRGLRWGGGLWTDRWGVRRVHAASATGRGGGSLAGG